MLINGGSVVLPRELHTRVAWTISNCHSHPALRNSAYRVVDIVHRSGGHCRSSRHIQSLRFVGLRHGSSVLSDENRRCLSRRGHCALDDRCAAVADCGLSDCLRASGDGRVLRDDLLDCCCLRACCENAGVGLHDGLRGRGLGDGVSLKSACDDDC